jgi:penicillin-binding protein 1A
MVMDELPKLIGSYHQDVIVDTTVDLDLQHSAENAIADALDTDGKKLRVSQAALVALDGTGAIRALIGGREYAESQFNRAVDARRQPGSAFKPIVYLTALEAGRTPDSVRQDAPVKIGDWTPENYDRKYRGPVTLSEALAQSLNSVAAQMVMEVGPKRVAETAKRLGIDSKIEHNASIALGTSEVTLEELTGAYAPFANGGYKVTPFLIRRVLSADGKILYQRNAAPPPQVVDQRELGMMNAMLTQAVNSGTGKAARIKGWQVAGKTGTTQNSRDALFVGYTANLIAGVWFGNDDGTPMKHVTGGTLPARTWARFMTTAHKGVPVAALPGNYLPKTAALPMPRPVNQISGQVSGQGLGQTASGGERLPSTERHDFAPAPGATGGVRPAQDVGGQNAGNGNRRRSLFDILFGARPG